MELDYDIDEPQVRRALVERQLKDCTPTQHDLSVAADYLLMTDVRSATKRERTHQYPITTKNRETTHAKRNVSLDAMGEIDLACSSVHTSPASSDRDPITERDIATVPGIADNMAVISNLRRQMECAQGRRRYELKCQIIQTYRENYLIRSSWRGTDPNRAAERMVPDLRGMDLSGEVEMDETGTPHDSSPVSLMDPVHVGCLLQLWERLAYELEDDLESDLKWVLMDLEAAVRRTFADDPFLMEVLRMKVLGYPNREVVDRMRDMFGEVHTEQWYSSTWTHRIPEMIADCEARRWLARNWKKLGGAMKRCSRCGLVKPAHPAFFNRNTSPDGFYTICRKCRSKGGVRDGGR